MKIQSVAIIGGGISGLACAYRLQELSKENQFPIELTLLEASSRLGGTISTLKQEDCLLELGPDAIFTEKPAALQLGKKIGLENKWVGTNPNYRKSFIYCKNKLYPVPEGFYLLAPSKIFPLLVSPLFTWRGKLRMLLEPFIHPKKSSEDESLASFVRRRFGEEVLERIAQPMIGGIYSTDPEELSLEATFPKFLEWERTFGSVTRGLMAQKSHHQSQGPRYSLFVTLKEGLGQFVRQIQENLPKGSIRLGAKVREIKFFSESISSESKKRFKLIYEDGLAEEFDAVAIATPSTISAKILRLLDPLLSEDLSEIEYASCATVHFIYKKEDFKNPMDGFGFVVPSSENKMISGCTFSSIKFPGRSPEDKIILRAFVGGKQYSNRTSATDNEIVRRVENELKEILALQPPPLFTYIHRHEKALPQYKVGHRKIEKTIRERINQWNGLTLCGNGYSGTGIPDCIESGQKAAETLFTYMTRQNKLGIN